MEGDRIKIEVKEYAKSGLQSARQTFGFGSASTRQSKTISTIFLPIKEVTEIPYPVIGVKVK